MMSLCVSLALAGAGSPQALSPFPYAVVATFDTQDPNGHNQGLFGVPHVVSGDGKALFALAGGSLKRYVVLRNSDRQATADLLFYEPRSSDGLRPDRSKPVYEFGQIKEQIKVSNPSGSALVSYPIWAASAEDVTFAHETLRSRFYVQRGHEFSPLPETEVRSGISRVRLERSRDRNQLLLSLNYPFRILATAKDRYSETYAVLVRELHVDEVTGETQRIGDYFALATGGAPNWISGKIPHSPGHSSRMLYDSKAGVIVCSGAGEQLLVYDVKTRSLRELRFDGWDRAELSAGGLAWFGEDSILVGVLKYYTYGEQRAITYTPEGPKETVTYHRTIIPKMYKVNLKTGVWTYLDSIALLGASANGEYLAMSGPTGTTIEVVKPARR